jgi:glycosyltransferase involved in cell wall biosynthesis
MMLQRKLNIKERRVILLFYKEYEADKFFKYDHYLKRLLRPLYHLLHHRQKKSGFGVSFNLMKRALINAGYEVRVNDYRTARSNPAYPVGIIGFPILLENWTLQNPAILGPSLYDHPMLAPKLFDDPRYYKYVALAPWTKELYEPVYGDRCFCWFAGLDLNEWRDLSKAPKSYDFLVYDKIYRNREECLKNLINPILRILEAKGLSYRVIRYKMYDHNTYRKLLTGARGLLFLCAHETQGLAYQEAMSSGVPVLAWDCGFWTDPLWKKYSNSPPMASSVPFFDESCGESFKDIGEFDKVLDRFMSKRSTYDPRSYVARKLNQQDSAKIYADQYFSLTALNNMDLH